VISASSIRIPESRALCPDPESSLSAPEAVIFNLESSEFHFEILWILGEKHLSWARIQLDSIYNSVDFSFEMNIPA
jgi:hypothetical protein